MTPQVLDASNLDTLLTVLSAGGRRVIGPRARDGAVIFESIRTAADLPRGLAEEQSPGRYRLVSSGRSAYFDVLLGPQSAKGQLFPARHTLFRAKRDASGLSVETPEPEPALALIGLRACDLAAIGIQDRVLRDGPTADPIYASRRSDLILVAVQCGRAASTCFCTSMGSGPRLSAGFDLALTEICEDDRHVFVIEVGSEAGEQILAQLPTSEASLEDADAPQEAADTAAAQIDRRLGGADTADGGLRERLLEAVTGDHWDEVATRCLGCANCTLVCPTCFCSQVTDVTDLTGATERVRTWDSCFTMEHSYMHGGSVRQSLGSRYRQWLTHKLATWWEQFDTSGCVGCGRCITWCPAGIDIVEEALAASSPETS